VIVNGAEMWDANPFLDTIPEFGALRKKYGDEQSGNAVLAIHYVYDPSSELRTGGFGDIEELRRRVSKKYLTEDVKWRSLVKQIQAYENSLVQESERQLERLRVHIEKGQRVLDEWEPTPKDLLNYNKVVKSTKELQDDFITLEQRVIEERQAVTAGRGRKSKSLTERLGKSD
jgi:hypothetical protein